MPLTDVQVVNIAMEILGEPPISSISKPETTNERLAARNYEQVVQEEITKRRWNFAIQHPALPADPSASHPQRKRAVRLTTDILRVLRPRHVDWIIQKPYIFTNEAAPLTVPCVKRVDEAEFDPLFNPVVGAALAMRINNSVTGSTEVYQYAKDQYQMAVNQALMANAFERGPVEMPEGGWVEAARYGHPVTWGADHD